MSPRTLAVPGPMQFALDLLRAGPLIERAGAWMPAGATGPRIRDTTITALARRELVTIGVTGLGRTAVITPKGALYRLRRRERLYLQRRRKPWPQDMPYPPG